VIIVTEDLEVVSPETEISCRPPAGERWRSMPPATRDPERIERLQKRVLEIVRGREYEEVFVALNKHYRQLLPDLTPHAKRVIAGFMGLGRGARALKEWLSR